VNLQITVHDDLPGPFYNALYFFNNPLKDPVAALFRFSRLPPQTVGPVKFLLKIELKAPRLRYQTSIGPGAIRLLVGDSL